MMLINLLINMPSDLFSAAGLHKMAENNVIETFGMEWIPFLNLWVLGSIADCYRTEVCGKRSYKRWILLAVGIAAAVLSVLMMALSSSVEGAFLNALLWFVTVVFVLGIVVGYMALYDVYAAYDPQNRWIFLIASVLFGIPTPILLFSMRNKEWAVPERLSIRNDRS